MSTELIEQLREYVGNPGYSHLDYADCMKEAADHIAALEYVKQMKADHIADLERQNAELVRQLAAQSEDSKRLLAVLIEAREALQFANDSPGGGISDTIWMMHRPETLFDFMDAAIDQAMQAGKEPTK